MNAKQLIEAEDPKDVFRKASGWVTHDRLKQLLRPANDFIETEIMGKRGFRKFRYAKDGVGVFYYFIYANSDGTGSIAFYRDYGEGKGLQYTETVNCRNMDYLLKHLRLFRLVEAEDPKGVFRQATQPYVFNQTSSTTSITDHKGNTINIDWTFGSPCIGWIRYQSDRDQHNADYGAKLLKAAYDFLRSKHEYRVRVSIQTTRAKSYGTMFDVDREDPAEIGNLIHAVEPECVTGTSGQVRYITLESVLALDPGGGLKLTAKPKAPHSIWTQRRRTEMGEPNPYHRVRTLPSGKPLEIYVAFHKEQAPTKLLSLAKKYGPHVAKMAHWAAEDLSVVLADKGISLVSPMPSAKPLARRLARLIANRLGVPFEERVEKTAAVSRLPINVRKAVAPSYYSASGKFRGQVVCLVDDYVVTSASLMAAADHVYRAGARKVLAAAFAI